MPSRPTPNACTRKAHDAARGRRAPCILASSECTSRAGVVGVPARAGASDAAAAGSDEAAAAFIRAQGQPLRRPQRACTESCCTETMPGENVQRCVARLLPRDAADGGERSRRRACVCTPPYPGALSHIARSAPRRSTAPGPRPMRPRRLRAPLSYSTAGGTAAGVPRPCCAAFASSLRRKCPSQAHLIASRRMRATCQDAAAAARRLLPRGAGS
jgi:hypothetical protein